MRAVVVGAGVMGAWTARWLRRRGHDVTLVDRFGPGNRVGSSGDASRITRSSHGTDRHYPRWQRRALAQWRELERSAGVPVFAQTGVAWFAAADEAFEADSLTVLTELGIPAERWELDELQRRLPVAATEGVSWAMFEPEAGALFARAAVEATVEQFIAEGGRLVVGRAEAPAGGEAGGALGVVRLVDGTALEADAFVFACGPWLSELFPDRLGDLIVPHRQDVLHFAVPDGDPRWLADRLPVWVDFARSIYGFPSFDGASVKACTDWLGPVERPDASAREIDPATIDATRILLRRRFPGLAEQAVVETRTCFYEVTPDANFVIDRHPVLEDTWIVGGGTGHAFKHGPVIGEYAAALVTADRAAVEELSPGTDRFMIGPREARTTFRTSGRNPLAAPDRESPGG